MDMPSEAQSGLVLRMWLLVQTLIANNRLLLPDIHEEEDNDSSNSMEDIIERARESMEDHHGPIQSSLQSFPFFNPLFYIDKDLDYWVKPRSMAWFSKFLMSEYDDTRWLELFRMPKRTVFALANLLEPQIRRSDTRYRAAIPVLIRVSCTLFKLARGVSFTICSKLFAIGKSSVCGVLRDVVHAINNTLKHMISFPTGERLLQSQDEFAQLCGLPVVVGAIDGTHISISKPRHGPVDYFYFKSGGYSLNCQAVMDSEKRFLDLYLGMPKSTNDSKVLRRSSLYQLASHGNLFNNHGSQEGFSPYLLGDFGYPLLPWLMVPHRHSVQLSMAESVYNRKLCKGRCVVENAFGILKQTFKELLRKSDLNVSFLPDVILCCAILHNTLLGQALEEVQRLLGVLRHEGLPGEDIENSGAEVEVIDALEGGRHAEDGARPAVAIKKRKLLGVCLTTCRGNAI